MFSKGDVVVCKDNSAVSHALTVDKEYNVLDSWSTGVRIINDKGTTDSFLSSRFIKKVTETSVKLEVGKTYLTASDYIVHIIAMSPVRNEYYTTIECSPGFNSSERTIQQLLASGDHSRQGDYKKYGWCYRPDGTVHLGTEWSEKLRIVREISKLQPAPEGFRYKDGFPQLRSPKKNEWYMGCMDGHAIQASHDEAKTLTRIILEKEESKMPTLPDGYKFASMPPEHRKPKRGEWFIGGGNKPDFAAVDFLNNAYYIIAKIEEKVSESYPKYYETSDRKRYAYRERVSENQYRVVYIDGRLGELGDWNNRGRSIDDVELTKEVALERIDKAVAKTPEPTPKEEVYPKYYSPLNIKDWAFIKRTNEFAHVLTKYDGTEVVSDTAWCKHHDALYNEIPEEVALAQIKKLIAQTPAPPKITNLCVEVPSMTSAAPLTFTKQRADRPQSRLSYWITEPVGNMFGAAKKSARYVVASSLLAVVGYTAFNPVQTFNFVGSCLPKINIKFGNEPLKFVPINDIPAVPAEWGNKNVGSP